MPNPCPRVFTPEDRTKAQRAIRYRFAEERIQKIVDGAPALTQEQRERLAAILLSGPTNAA